MAFRAFKTLKRRGYPRLLTGICGATLMAMALPACDDGGETISYNFDQQAVGLLAFDGCDELLAYFQAEAIADLEMGFGGAYAVSGARDLDIAAGGEAAPSTDGDQNAAPAHSGTNTQEANVDEPDAVKTDGDYIYVAHGDHLLIYNADDLSLESDTVLPMWGTRLLLDGQNIVAVGQRWGEVPGGAQAGDAQDDGAQADDTQRWANHTLLAIYNVADRAQPQEVRRYYLEGQLVDARLTGRTVRAVIQHYPTLPEGDVYSGGGTNQGGEGGAEPAVQVDVERSPLNAELEDLINATTIDDWLPRFVNVIGEARTTGRAVSCEAFYRPGQRSGVGVTTVVSIDLDEPLTRLSDTGVVAAAGVVYASTDSLYMGTANYRAWAVNQRGGVAVPSTGTATVSTDGEAPPDSPAMGTERSGLLDDATRQTTQIHKFDIRANGQPAVYAGSGRIFGTILNAYSLGEYEGHLRVATTEEQIDDDEWRRVNHLFVLAQAADELNIVGAVEGLAEDERIYAMRFIGDVGYMVTFRQMDPLFTIDLSDPTDPTVVGELHIPGFSTYLHPISDDHLLGVGMDADEEGRVRGMQVSLFDVSDAAAPTLAHKVLMGEGQSEASYDPHAFTWWAPSDLLVLPNRGWNDQGEKWDGLNLYDVNITDGFADLGFIDHTAISESAHVSRSIVIGERLYSISDRGILVHGLADLERQALVAFPEIDDGRDRPDGGEEIDPQPVPADGGDPDDGGDDEPQAGGTPG